MSDKILMVVQLCVCVGSHSTASFTQSNSLVYRMLAQDAGFKKHRFSLSSFERSAKRKE